MYPQDLVYISRSRLHRNRANLIQTLQTATAFQRIGVHVHLYLPPWRKNVRLNQRLEELGIHSNLDVRPSRFLRSRWRRFAFWPFIQIHRSRLRKAGAIYTRSAEVSSALASAGLVHHLEIHDTRQLSKTGLLEHTIRHHRSRMIDWLVPISQAGAANLVGAGAVQERVHCKSLRSGSGRVQTDGIF